MAGEQETSATDVLNGQAQERWLPVVGFEGRYEVSDQGRVRSLLMTTRFGSRPRDEPMVLRPIHHANGYVAASLRSSDHQQHILMVHRIVLTAFEGPPPDGHEGCHLNGRRSDNRLENLKWATRRENHSHKLPHGTAQRGEKCGKAVLKWPEVRAIRERYMRGSRRDGIRAIARDYGVSFCCIQLIVTRRTWVEVPNDLPLPTRDYPGPALARRAALGDLPLFSGR